MSFSLTVLCFLVDVVILCRIGKKHSGVFALPQKINNYYMGIKKSGHQQIKAQNLPI